MPYLSALEISHYKALYKSMHTLLYSTVLPVYHASDIVGHWQLGMEH